MKTKLLSKTYVISEGRFSIFAVINSENKLTLRTHLNGSEFKFINSDPAVVKVISKMLVEATKLD